MTTRLLTILCVSLPLAADAAEPVDFASEIRPILSANCFACHGPDASVREADLRLDTKEGAFADLGDGRRPFVAGKPVESEAFVRISSDDPLVKMPPPDSGHTLTAEQIGLVKRWIEEGAKWSGHWAFVPPTRPALPDGSFEEWRRTPIDAFIAERLKREGLEPSPKAQKAILLRRLSLDLIGLPPSPEDVEAFLADRSPDAYRRQVERLLKSPHYGERWGRIWLDAARYADSDGFEKDKPREVWFYRDWVINALNRDLPYDEFIIKQIAGDLLPETTQDDRVATGFLRNSMINEEGGVDPEQFRMEAMFDRMDAIGKSILGITIQCGQCHNHKYDPLTQTDYYRMFAFINNSHEAQITVYTPEEQKLRDRIRREQAKIEAALKQDHPDWKQQLAKWEKDYHAQSRPEWQPVALEFDAKTIGGQKFLPQSDGSYLCQGYAPTRFRPQMTAETQMETIRAVRLELLTDPNLPHGGPGRSIWGTAALSEFEVEAAPLSDPSKFKKLKIKRATADLNLPERPLKKIYDDRSGKKRVTGPIDFAIDGDVLTAWGTDAGPGRRNQPREAVFELAEPVAFPGGAILRFSLTQRHGGWNSDDNQNHNIGRFRISLTGKEHAEGSPVPKRVREILGVPAEQRTEKQQAALFSYWRTTVPDWKEQNDRIEELWEGYPAGTSQLVLMERDVPRPTHRLERGNFLKKLERVEPGVPDFLHDLPKSAEPDRLAFARWLVDRDSPTTARSIVNRVWQAYFGIGLVETAEDLGSQGTAPSHPKLLDWLAVEFMESGWSLKHLHRLIVNSATYRQSSAVTQELSKRDPYNRLLARGPRFRVDAEIVRDAALAASGLLNRKVGGPSVYPPAPEFLFQPPASYGPKRWETSTGAEKYRRAIYTFRFRSVPYPALEAFDAPNGDFSCVRRARSNTPLQALTTLNEPIFFDCAKALARRVLDEAGPTTDDRLAYAFRLCVARQPTEKEARVLSDFLDKQQARFAKDQAAAKELLGEDKPSRELAAWTALARVLLNLDETITKE